MKRTLLFMAYVLTSIMMSAQESSYFDYVPFVKEGKKWHVVHTEYDTNYHREQYVLRNENVTKTDKTYMTMYRTEDVFMVIYDEGVLNEVGLYREEDRKVFFFDDNTQKEYLMFDYSLQVGDTYETYSYDNQKMVTYKVLSVGDYTEGPEVIHYTQEADSMRAEYRYLRKWTVCRADDNSLQKTWIEGVGSLEGPLANLYDARPISSRDYLAYVVSPHDYYRFDDLYLPFSFYDTMNMQVHGSDLTIKAKALPGDMNTQLTYELDGNRLHVYGKAVIQSIYNNYAYFYEETTDDPFVHKLRFEIQNVQDFPTSVIVSLCAIDFYVPGFDPNLNYIIVDNHGEEHPVINKTPQMAYRPFVEDGKIWQIGGCNTGNPVQLVEYYYFDGDTIIDGKACKQMMCQRFVSPDFPEYDVYSQQPPLNYVGAWYEEDKKVYFYDASTKQLGPRRELMYDFSLEPYDTLQIHGGQSYVIGPRLTGGLKGFKGVYRDVWECGDGERIYPCAPWLEGVGGIYGSPTINVFNEELADPAWFLMACIVGDEVIYLNDEYEDGATPKISNAPKSRLDFTHIIKTKPKAPIKREKSDACISSSEHEVVRPKVKMPMRREAEKSIYGEYNDLKLGINLDPIDEAYLVRITDETGKAVYEKAINAGNIVGLNIDISAYPKGCYTVTIENSSETFTGQFETETTEIVTITNHKEAIRTDIYNLQGQRISTLQKGLNIVNGRKVYIK